MLVVGAPNSSNSRRLVEVGRPRRAAAYAQLVQRAADIDWRALEGIRSVGDHGWGVSAGGPDQRGDRRLFCAAMRSRVELVETAVENVEFKVPRVLRMPA